MRDLIGRRIIGPRSRWAEREREVAVARIAVGRNHSGPTCRWPSWADGPAGPRTPGTLYVGSTTDFEEFFALLYPSLQTYAWVLANVQLAFPPTWAEWFDEERQQYRGPELDEFESYTLLTADDEYPERLRVVRSGFLERYARYIDDDWCEIAGVPESMVTPELVHLCQAAGPLWRLAQVDVWFQNVDAGFWQMTSKNEDLVERVREHVQRRPDLRIREFLVDV